MALAAAGNRFFAGWRARRWRAFPAPKPRARSLRSFGGRAFAAQRRRFRFFFFADGFFHTAGKIAAGYFAATDHRISSGHGNVDPCSEAIDAISADWKPASGVQKIADVFAD